MRRIAFNEVHADFNKRHEVSPPQSLSLYYYSLPRNVDKKVTKCFPQRDKSSNPKPSLRKGTNANANPCNKQGGLRFDLTEYLTFIKSAHASNYEYFWTKGHTWGVLLAIWSILNPLMAPPWEASNTLLWAVCLNQSHSINVNPLLHKDGSKRQLVGSPALNVNLPKAPALI